MSGWYLVLNAGSSSLKFAAFAAQDLKRLAHGSVDHFGQPEGNFAMRIGEEMEKKIPLHRTDRVSVLEQVLAEISRVAGGSPNAVGHRVVHGGPKYFAPTRITSQVLAELRGFSPFDPEHLPAEIEIIEALQKQLPDVAQVAAFDTEFHRDLPTVARLLPLPRRYESQGLRRYGFHGLSYTYLLGELQRLDPDRARGRVILAHLGSGASMAAVREGKCIDTSMSFTPTAGLVMGTRTGDLDPGIFSYLAETEKMPTSVFNQMVNHESGLRGISGTSSDIRKLTKLAPHDPRAAEALEIFCYQAKKFLGAYVAASGGLDALVFSGGIGENAPALRAKICEGLQFLGVELAEPANTLNAAVISSATARVSVRVIATDEELVIARSLGAFSRP